MLMVNKDCIVFQMFFNNSQSDFLACNYQALLSCNS